MGKRGPKGRPFDSMVVVAPSGCWEWSGSRFANGYGRFCRDGRTWTAHRYQWTRAHGEPPAGLVICHRCDNRACVNPAHLFLGTPAEYLADMAAKGRSLAGRRNPQVKLTEADVRAIRSSDETRAALARRYGVSEALVYAVATGKAWRSVA